MRNKTMFDLKNEGQGHAGRQWQSSHSVANIKLNTYHIWSFFASSHRFKDIHILNLMTLKCMSKPWCTTFAGAPYDGKYLISYLMAIIMAVFSQPILVKIAQWKVWPWKLRSRSLTIAFALLQLDGDYQTAIKSYGTFCAYRLRDINTLNIWQILVKVTSW